MIYFREKFFETVREDELERLETARHLFSMVFNDVFGFLPQIEAHEKRTDIDRFKVAGIWMICENKRLYARGRRIIRPCDMMETYTQEFMDE